MIQWKIIIIPKLSIGSHHRIEKEQNNFQTCPSHSQDGSGRPFILKRNEYMHYCHVIARFHFRRMCNERRKTTENTSAKIQSLTKFNLGLTSSIKCCNSLQYLDFYINGEQMIIQAVWNDTNMNVWVFTITEFTQCKVNTYRFPWILGLDLVPRYLAVLSSSGTRWRHRVINIQPCPIQLPLFPL